MPPDVRLLRNFINLSTRLASIFLIACVVMALTYGLIAVKQQYEDFHTLKRYETYQTTLDELTGEAGGLEGALREVGKDVQQMKVAFSLDPPSQMKRPNA